MALVIEFGNIGVLVTNVRTIGGESCEISIALSLSSIWISGFEMKGLEVTL